MRQRLMLSGVKWAVAITVGVIAASTIVAILRLIGIELTPSTVLAIVLTYETVRLFNETKVSIKTEEKP